MPKYDQAKHRRDEANRVAKQLENIEKMRAMFKGVKGNARIEAFSQLTEALAIALYGDTAHYCAFVFEFEDKTGPLTEKTPPPLCHEASNLAMEQVADFCFHHGWRMMQELAGNTSPGEPPVTTPPKPH